MKVFRNTTLHLLSLPVVLLIVWSGSNLILRPSFGIFWDASTGVVYQVDLEDTLSEEVRQGDRVISGNGLSPALIYNLDGKSIGDVIFFQFEREGEVFTKPLEVAGPSVWLMLDRSIPLVIAFGFLFAGNFVFAYFRRGHLSTLFYFFCLFAAVSLSSGALSSIGPAWTKPVFQVGSFCTLVLLIHLHLFFPVTASNRVAKCSGFLLMGITLALASYYGLVGLFHPIFLLVSIFQWLPLILICVDILFVVIVLERAYRKSETAIARNQAGIIIFSGLIGFLPILSFSLIPHLIAGYPLISYSISFFSLLFIPVGYGYAILRFRLLGTEKTVHRGATNALLVILLGGVFSIWYVLSIKLLSAEIAHSPFWLLCTVLLLSVLTNKAYRTLANFANRVLYGGWYDYRSVVGSVSLSFDVKNVNEETVGETLCRTIGKSMRLEYAGLLLQDQYLFTYLHGQAIHMSQTDSDLWPAMLACLESTDSQKRLIVPVCNTLRSSPDLLLYGGDQRVKHLIPLHGKSDQILGLLLLGTKLDGQELGKGDVEILRVIIQQSQIILENTRLLRECQQHINMISRLHMQVIRSREGERKRLARDLHDVVIQMLIGINFKIRSMEKELTNLQAENMTARQAEIQQVIKDLRQICTDLRPANLEISGLVPAIQSKAAEIEQQAGFQVSFLLEGNEEQEICEESKICVYRFVQECLINVQKHAKAKIVQLWVQITSETVTVNIVDDGIGFPMPTNLDCLVEEKHFGLVGLKELVESVNGIMQVSSKPGEGCTVSVQVPV